MPRNVSEYIRQSLYKTAALLSELSPHRLAVTEWSDIFEALMRNRLIMGAIRYGRLATPRPKGITNVHMQYIDERIKRYKETGNTEALVDVANLCLVEFVVGDHPKKHFKSLERE